MYRLILLLALYLPFQVALNPTESVDLASVRVYILGLFFGWLVEGLRRKNLKIAPTVPTFLIGTFLFFNAFSLFLANNQVWAIRKLIFFLSIFPIYLVTLNLIDSQRRVQQVISWLIAGGTLVALVGIVQFLLQFVIGLETTYALWAEYVVPPFLGRNFSQMVLTNPSWLVNVSGVTYLRATSFFPDPHMFSFYLGLLIPLALGRLLQFQKENDRAAGLSTFFIASLIVMVVADILTFSRGGYLGLGLGALALMLLFWDKIQRKYKLVGLLFGFFVIALFLVPSPISQRFFSSFSLREGSNMGRIKIWQEAVEVIQDHPQGVGLGNYPLTIKPTADYREPIYAHNTYLDVAVETGVGNALIWISLLLSSAMTFLGAAKRNPIFLGAFISLVIFSAHSMVETGLYSPVVLTLLLIIISFSGVVRQPVDA